MLHPSCLRKCQQYSCCWVKGVLFNTFSPHSFLGSTSSHKLVWIMTRQTRGIYCIFSTLPYSYCMPPSWMQAVSCGHMVSLVEIRASHMSLAGLSKLWQVTRAAPGWSPWRHCALPAALTGDDRTPSDRLHSHTFYNKHLCGNPLTYWPNQTHQFSHTLIYSIKKKLEDGIAAMGITY